MTEQEKENRRCPIWVVHISCLVFGAIIHFFGWGTAIGAMIVGTVFTGAIIAGKERRSVTTDKG